MSKELLHQKINLLNICIVIPTYNNDRTLLRVIDGVLNYTTNIIVINDGSTDSTSKILANYTQIQLIHLKKNKGKGNALRLGFKKATELGYDYAISIDSDGQHYPDDIPVFIETLDTSKNKKLLLIGARNMDQEGVPGKSSFGNKFSNFWFWFETGITLKDTQSGFRLYPLKALEALNFYTNKFEFEIEVIVKSAWSGIDVKNIPIKVLYDENERISHFRPFKDFTRISILNTWLVLVTLFYIKPRNLYRTFKKKGFKQFFTENVLGSQDSPTKKALSITLGLFIGLSPLWGFHTVSAIALAALFKLNKFIAFTFSNISFPPLIPFILYASYKIGQSILGIDFKYTLDTFTTNFDITQHLKTYIIGSFVLATICATFCGILSFIIFSFLNKKK